jgi:1-acyl-sn-glycerol-3-phosphate acyltransferase
VIRALLYYCALLVATLWYAGRCVVAGWLRVPWRRGGVYDLAQRHWARMILRVAGIPVTIEGEANLQEDTPQIIASNHASFFDILALLGYLPVDAKFIAKKEIFRIPVLGAAMRAAGHVSMDRGHQKQAFGAYEVAAAQMRERRLTIVVYPEGTRTRTGELLPFKKGPFVFATASKVPIVPCYVGGAFQIQPKGSLLVRRHRIHIALGRPISVEGLTMDDRDEIAERVRNATLSLKMRVDGVLAPS